MSKLMDKVIIKRRHLIVDAEEVLHVLGVIQSHHSVVPDMNVGNCGWANSPDKWFVYFDCSNAKWDLIRYELQVVRVFATKDIPNGQLGVVYTTD